MHEVVNLVPEWPQGDRRLQIRRFAYFKELTVSY